MRPKDTKVKQLNISKVLNFGNVNYCIFLM